MAINTVTTVNKNDVTVQEISIPPNGTSHDLQERITLLMHDIVLLRGKATLANLGYLGINTLLYNKERGTLDLKVYFDAHYATRVRKSDVNSSREIVLVEPLTMFEGYLYSGDIHQVVSYEKILAPKSKAVRDEVGMVSMQVKDGAKLVETNALVLNCSLPLTLAAVFDINLNDPDFDIACTTVGKGGKSATKCIVTSANAAEVPVEVKIRYSSEYEQGYNPDDAEAYLVALNDKIERAASNQAKLKRDVKKKADKREGKMARKSSAGFNKYS